MIACTIGWAESAESMTVDRAYPRMQKVDAPITAVMAMPGMVDVATRTPYAIQPMASSMVITPTATAIALSMRPRTSTSAGTGVARRRLKMPVSRWAVIVMTRFTNDEAITARVAI